MDEIHKIEIGCLSDFYTKYEQSMKGDFPFWFKMKNKLHLHIPERTFNEIKWLGSNQSTTVREISQKSWSKLKRQCEEAFMMKPGLGYMGTKYVYKNMCELIGRRTWYQPKKDITVYHKLKCTEIQIIHGDIRAIFSDSLIKKTFNDDQLQELGFSKIIE